MSDLQCLRCQSKMEKGFIPDFGHTDILLGSWIEGEMEKTWRGALKLEGRKKIDLSAFRCTKCGSVELNAPEP